MASKTWFKRVKRFDAGLTVFIVFCLIVVGSLFFADDITGLVVKRYRIPFNEQFCSNPDYPVPVFSEETGGLGHKQFIGCSAEVQPVQNQRIIFPVTQMGDKDILNTPIEPHQFYPVPNK